ncbi:hypothetical protein EYZ11_006196 [Aspergillus tanneri]|uniref:Uncharacterized protein n=1 Tax=Aspergillus tanneri TaxID=1220188 RepID=A0A4S3JGG2_9EURO|nr:hypothetical protein EYZ11_006196 [Aspergillus tanneri]
MSLPLRSSTGELENNSNVLSEADKIDPPPDVYPPPPPPLCQFDSSIEAFQFLQRFARDNGFAVVKRRSKKRPGSDDVHYITVENLLGVESVHVPSYTWFKSDNSQTLDWDLQERHLEFLIRSGLHGIVIAGANGEAATLSTEEKTKLLRLTRSIAKRLGRADLPITCGTYGGCTRSIIQDTRVAADAGANFVLVLAPFFHFALDSATVVAFFQEVADASPIPVVIYNYPGMVNGLNVNWKMLEILGEHPNIVAAKLTCGTISSVTRTAAKFGPGLDTADPAFVTLAGQSDCLANLYPKTCMEIFDLYNSGKRAEAEDLQRRLAVVEYEFVKGGINGTKWVVAKYLGYPEENSRCRRPHPQFLDVEKREWIVKQVHPLKEAEDIIVARHN